jgi:hypothetical protein
MGVLAAVKNGLYKISGILVLAGCLFVAFDAFCYQKNASKRESSRCDQIKKITEALIEHKDDPQAVEFYCKQLNDLADSKDSYRWTLGSSLSK